MGIIHYHERRSQPPDQYVVTPDGKLYKAGTPEAETAMRPFLEKAQQTMTDKYSQYDSVLLKPLERLKSEERVGLAKDLLVLLSDDEWLSLRAMLPPETNSKMA